MRERGFPFSVALAAKNASVRTVVENLPMDRQPSRKRFLGESQTSLIAEARTGDPRALSALLRSARSVVFHWTAVRAQDLDDAEDITQLVLLKLYTGLPKFRGESKLSSWLYRITEHEISGYYGRRTRERRIRSRWHDPSFPPASVVPDPERVDRDRLSEAIHAAAEALPPLQLSVFRRVDLCGMRPGYTCSPLPTNSDSRHIPRRIWSDGPGPTGAGAPGRCVPQPPAALSGER